MPPRGRYASITIATQVTPLPAVLSASATCARTLLTIADDRTATVAVITMHFFIEPLSARVTTTLRVESNVHRA